MNFEISLLILAVLSFVQNMAFTAVSRSRNSGDTKYHFKVALASNGVWFATQVFILKHVWDVLESGDWWKLIIVGFVYTISTAAGSTYMMAKLLKSETGKRRVGAR